MVQCKICDTELRQIHWSHLRKHGISIGEYKLKFGNNTMDNDLKMMWKSLKPWKGKHRSLKTKKKISKAVSLSLKEQYRTGKRKPVIIKYWKNKNLPEYMRNKISKSLRKSTSNKLENHPAWKGGISFEPYGIEFNTLLKKVIYKRFDYKCCVCKRKMMKGNGKFQVHHIDYNKQNNSIENLVLLCCSCHPKTNWNREHWRDFFKQYVGYM